MVPTPTAGYSAHTNPYSGVFYIVCIYAIYSSSTAYRLYSYSTAYSLYYIVPIAAAGSSYTVYNCSLLCFYHFNYSRYSGVYRSIYKYYYYVRTH